MIAQNGILVVNKPKGMTSHDVVQRLRRAYSMKKVGHTGTLDPIVDGVLVICFGRATKLAEYLTNESKKYYVTICLGIATDSEDITGKIIVKEEIKAELVQEISLKLGEVLSEFTGEYHQIPPMYSAIKVEGRKLYEYARNDEIIERSARILQIHSLEWEQSSLSYNSKNKTISASFTVFASKGIYARTLCVDIGKKLNLPATMLDLTRLASGMYEISEAIPLDKILTEKPELIKMEAIKLPLRVKFVEPEVANKLKIGYRLPHYFIDEAMNEQFIVKNSQTNELIGIFEQSPKYADKYASVKIM
ncbi:MAG: tRNA pseudouridine(55) synthase TruB [Culicoidibacterales bacterium]